MFACEGGRCEKISEANYRQKTIIIRYKDRRNNRNMMTKKTSAFKQLPFFFIFELIMDVPSILYGQAF